MTEVFVFIIVLCLFLVAVGVLIWLFLSLASFVYTSVPYVPVPKEVAKEVALIVKKHQTERPVVFYDIGSGDGRVVYAVAKEIPDGDAIGIEIAPAAYLTSLLRKKLSGLKNVRILFRNALSLSFSDATHVFMYLLPRSVQSMSKKLESELKVGATIICCDFPIEGQDPKETHTVRGRGKNYTLYVYRV